MRAKLGIFFRCPEGRLFLVRNRMDHHPRTHGQQPFHHHAVSGLQSLFDQPGIADARAGLHRTGFDLVPLRPP
jgi:hypothetical protein